MWDDKKFYFLKVNDYHDIVKIVTSIPKRRVEEEDWDAPESVISNSSDTTSVVAFIKEIRRPTTEEDWDVFFADTEPRDKVTNGNSEALINGEWDEAWEQIEPSVLIDQDILQVEADRDIEQFCETLHNADQEIDGLSDLEEHDVPDHTQISILSRCDSGIGLIAELKAEDFVLEVQEELDQTPAVPSTSQGQPRSKRPLELDPVDSLILEIEGADARFRSKPCKNCFDFHSSGACPVMSNRGDPGNKALIAANKAKFDNDHPGMSRAIYSERIKRRRANKQRRAQERYQNQ